MRTFILLAGIFLTASCVKEKQAQPLVSPPRTWTISGHTYSQTKVTRSKYATYRSDDSLLGITFISQDSLTRSLQFSFTAPPVGGRQYKIVEFPLKEDEVSVFYSDIYGFTYDSRGTSEQYLSVTSENTELRYVGVEVIIRSRTFVTDHDSKLSFDLRE